MHANSQNGGAFPDRNKNWTKNRSPSRHAKFNSACRDGARFSMRPRFRPGNDRPIWEFPIKLAFFSRGDVADRATRALKYTKWLHLFSNGPLLCIQRILKYAIVYSTDLLCIFVVYFPVLTMYPDISRGGSDGATLRAYCRPYSWYSPVLTKHWLDMGAY